MNLQNVGATVFRMGSVASFTASTRMRQRTRAAVNDTWSEAKPHPPFQIISRAKKPTPQPTKRMERVEIDPPWGQGQSLR